MRAGLHPGLSKKKLELFTSETGNLGPNYGGGDEDNVNSREGTQLHPSTENLIKDLLIMALPIRTRPSFPLNPSLPSGSFHKPLILLHQKADRLRTTITKN